MKESAMIRPARLRRKNYHVAMASAMAAASLWGSYANGQTFSGDSSVSMQTPTSIGPGLVYTLARIDGSSGPPYDRLYMGLSGVPGNTGNTLSMESQTFNSIPVGQDFALSHLTYFNDQTQLGTNADFLPVNLGLAFTNPVIPATEFSFQFQFTITPNQPTGTPEENADRLDWISNTASQSFTVGGHEYSLVLRGFAGTAMGGSLSNTFLLYEDTTVDSYLMARIEEVDSPELAVTGTGSFGQVRVGTTGTQSITAANNGTAGSTITATLPAAGGEFAPTSTQDVAIAGGTSTSRNYTYTPTARGSDSLPLQVTSDAGNVDVTLTGQGVGPVYASVPPAGSTINVGRVMLSTGGQSSLPISNVTTDGDLGALTDMTLRSFTSGGAHGSEFSMTGVNPGDVVHAGGMVPSGVKLTPASTGAKSATLAVSTDVNAALGAAGETYNYNLSGVVVDKRTIVATPVDFGRVMVSTAVSGSSTLSTAGDDDHFTRTTVSSAAQGPDGNNMSIGAGSGVTFNGVGVTENRGVGGTFASTGSKTGQFLLPVTGEGLPGEGTYSPVAVNYTANPVQDRTITAAPVSFPNAFVGYMHSAQSTTLTTAGDDADFTRVTVNAGSFTDGQATAAISPATLFDGPSKTTGGSVSAAFGSSGVKSGSVMLTAGNGGVTGEGLAGENVKSVAINYSAIVYDHGNASFNNAADQNILNLNVGSFLVGSGMKTSTFSIYNLLASASYTQHLDMYSVVSSGELAKVSANLPATLSNFMPGAQHSFTATLDTSEIGQFDSSYTLNFADPAGILGGTTQSITLNLSGRVIEPEPLPKYFVRNPGFEDVWPDRFTPTPDLPSDVKTSGFDTSLMFAPFPIPRYIPGWHSAGTEMDAVSGVWAPTQGGPYPGNDFGGSNVAYNDGEVFYQTLSDDPVIENDKGRIEGDKPYVFSVKVGQLGDGSYARPDVALLAGNTVLPYVDEIQPDPGGGAFATWTRTYRIGSHDPLIAQPLTIRVAQPGGTKAQFDDFSLVKNVTDSMVEMTSATSALDRGDLVIADDGSGTLKSNIAETKDFGYGTNWGYVDITGLPAAQNDVWVLLDISDDLPFDLVPMSDLLDSLTVAGAGTYTLLTGGSTFDALIANYASSGLSWDAAIQFPATTNLADLKFHWDFASHDAMLVDHVAAVVGVPEPGGLLAGIGVGMPMLMRRRRKSRR